MKLIEELHVFQWDIFHEDKLMYQYKMKQSNVVDQFDVKEEKVNKVEDVFQVIDH